MKRPSRARKVTPMNEVVPAETVVYFVEFLPLTNKSPIVAQSFHFFSREIENRFFPQMLATNLINK